jgi:hypothetical protein
MDTHGTYPDSDVRRYALRFRKRFVYRVCSSQINGAGLINKYVRVNRDNQPVIDMIMGDLACKIGFLDGFDFMAERITSAGLTTLVADKFGRALPQDGLLYAIHLRSEPDANWSGEEITDEHLNWYFLLVTSRGLRYLATLSREELYAMS